MAKNIEVKSKHVLPSTGYYEINNGKSVYRLFEKMTPPMNQDKLAEFYNSEKEKGNPLPINSIQLFGIMEDAVKSDDKGLINYIQEGLETWPNTLSRVVYNPEGFDEIIHNYGTNDSYSVNGNLVGESGLIKNINNQNALELILGTKDTNRINEVANAINKTQMYLWRFDSRPKEKVEKVVSFNANPNRIYLDVNRSLYGGDPSFLVSVAD